jgi:hypothetical protein
VQPKKGQLPLNIGQPQPKKGRLPLNIGQPHPNKGEPQPKKRRSTSERSWFFFS